MFLRVASFFYTIEAAIPRGKERGCFFIEKAMDGEPRQKEDFQTERLELSSEEIQRIETIAL